MTNRASLIRVRRAAAGILLAASLSAACGAPSEGARTEDAFRGKTVRIIVGSSPGGGYDLHARVLGDFLGRHLPGSPTVIVESMNGAGGLIAANYVARQAKPDGLTLGLLGLG